MSYRKKHIKSKVHRIKIKKSILKNWWFWVTILILIVVSFGFYFVFFYSGFQLNNVVVLGSNKAKNQDLQKLVINDAKTGLINFRNIKLTSQSIFLINKEKINKDILEKFPMIEKVNINEQLPQTLILDVVERSPLGVFCPSTDENNCFLIDNNGVIFESLTTTPIDATIVRQTMESGQIFIGENVVAQNIIDATPKIKKNLKDNFQIDLKEALITSSVRLNVKTNENWQIYFDLSPDSDINSQLIKLNSLLSGGISTSERKNLRYIDLRPKDRAIICDNSVCGG